MTSNEEIREFAEGIDTDELPQDNLYRVMAARPQRPVEPVTEPIRGKYHALYARDKIMDERGYAGVSFHIEEVEEGDA